MAGTVPRGLFPRRVSGQSSIPLWSHLESSSHTSAKGAVLVYTSGYLDLAAADVTAGIAGVSDEAGHNITQGTQLLSFFPALPAIRFEGTLEDETNNNHALVITNVGVPYALQIDATNDRWYIDENDTGNDSVIITKLIDALTTVKGRVEFVFLVSSTIFGA